MPVDECGSIRDLLVDFVDDELDGAELRRVSSHVDSCGDCAGTVAALRRSLACAERVWDADHTTQAPSTGVARRTQSIVWLRRVRRGLAVAAIVGLALLSWPNQRGRESFPPDHVSRSQNHHKRLPTPFPSVAESISIEDVEALIWKAGTAARMLETAHILAEAPGGKQLAAARLRIVLSEYADTPSAAIARQRLTLLGGTAQ